MKNIIIIICLCLIGYYTLFSQDNFTNDKLYMESAFADTVGKAEFSLFRFSNYQLCDNLQLKAHPIFVFLSPSILIKWTHKEYEKSALASYHSISYPSMMLRTIQKKGTLGIISPEFDLPNMISINNGIIYSYEYDKSHYLTTWFGFDFSINNFNPDERTTIDLPVIYPRDAVYYKKYGMNFYLGTEAPLFKKFRYLISTEGFLFPKDESVFFWENSLKIIWQIKNNFSLCGGAFLSYGEYPYGNQWHLLPSIDFKWDFNFK